MVIPERYESILDKKETAAAIQNMKSFFQTRLGQELQLTKVSAPVLVREGTGINDNLNGTERTVSFDVMDMKEARVEIVQSLAKWKRAALAQYGFSRGEGLYTDMKAIRRDEVMDNLHSIYVDQWDWEKIISEPMRNMSTLQTEVKRIYDVLKSTEKYMCEFHSSLEPILPERIHFITAQELEDRYPALSPKEREQEITREYGAVFIMQIGGVLNSGRVHDGRSPDYDDWSLNGDIVLWYPVLNCAVEISSMGIRVDAQTLRQQLSVSGNQERLSLDFHQAVLSGELPATIGGGIGQSRLCMFFLKKAHIGEVQVSVWNDKTIKECQEGNIPLL
ncbi:aspartate--ammonia ligase [Paenibacillus solani]|uniref:aspartate--ammonia ligase n=1 Tax=Paenibacillus solani TaxID=1705565 RepID=UPI0030FEDAA0